ncbi:hypothetical protein [Bacillus cereus]|uniref:hypothetical protein n=1 Tax=Bacillus cereus TaxID=1396 RepID=UPI000B4A9255|nr:hypothetical protein [Bacillus cereus]
MGIGNTVLTGQEVVDMNCSRENEFCDTRKDLSWTNGDYEYVIRNIPMIPSVEDPDECYYDAQVSLKLMILKKGMESKEIPSELDYRDFEDIVFE